MSSITAVNQLIVPVSRVAIATRPATMDDIPFIDGLQKIHTHMVGWMPKAQLEGKIRLGHVLIAEGSRVWGLGSGVSGEDNSKAIASSARPETRDPRPDPLGYCISQDTYSGRDDVGIVYQLNVVPMQQRQLIGASLLKAVFERAAYGCRLFCCWCAQDIQANYFWQSCGFVPLAFRTGSRGKQRVHIFWQRRLREGDQTTPYWYPFQTKNGAVREDRLVLPIPPGTSWRDAKPILLPGESASEQSAVAGERKKLPAPPPAGRPPVTYAKKMAIVRSQSRALQGLPPGKAAVITSGGLKYIDRGDYVPEPEPVPDKPKRQRQPAAKHDPKHVALARELRDRWLEEVNAGRFLPEAEGKYDVARAALPAPPAAAAAATVARLEDLRAA